MSTARGGKLKAEVRHGLSFWSHFWSQFFSSRLTFPSAPLRSTTVSVQGACVDKH